MNARFLRDDEKYYATQRLAENRTGIADKDRSWKWSQVVEALLDVKVWIVFFFNIAVNIPNGGLVTFGSIVIKGLGFDALDSSLLTMPFGVFATFSAWIFSYIAAKWHNRRTVVASISLLLPLLGTGLMYGLPKSIISAQMVGLYLAYLYWRKSACPLIFWHVHQPNLPQPRMSSSSRSRKPTRRGKPKRPSPSPSSTLAMPSAIFSARNVSGKSRHLSTPAASSP